MRFYIKKYNLPLNEDTYFPCLVLVKDSWDDFGHKTSYSLYYYSQISEKEYIGYLKILDENSTTTSVPLKFRSLPSNFASLGQEMDYYHKMKELFPEKAKDLLDSLNDLALNPGLRDRFENDNGFADSLLRNSEAEKALQSAAQIFTETGLSKNNKFSFEYSVKLPYAEKSHDIQFEFDNNVASPFRNYVLIGKNGTGKTQFLAHLANSLSDNKSSGKFNPTRPLFSRVIAISYSLFDTFEKPRSTKRFSYKYIGFRHNNTILRPNQISANLRKAFKSIKKLGRIEDWFLFMKDSIDLSKLNIEDDFYSNEERFFEDLLKNRETQLSSGQNIIIFTITELISNLRTDSIVLFDEPETHLHPNAISKLIRILYRIFKHYNSFAIIATHSPLVVQETPSSNVWLFDRIGGAPLIKKLPMETFGENISKITDLVFYKNEVKEIYKDFFDQEIKSKSIAQINKQFEMKLGLNALLYLNSIHRNRD